MRKLLSILLLLLCVAVQVRPQDRTIDSLKHLVPRAKNDSITLQLLLDIGSQYQYRIRKLDSALLYYQKVLELARKRNITVLQLVAINNMANIYNHSTGNYSEALGILLRNLKLGKLIRDTSNQISFTKREIMWVYRNMGNHQKELELAIELDSFVNSGYYRDPETVNTYQNAVYYNLANTYLELNEIDSAIRYRTRLCSRAKQTKEPLWMALATDGLADLYIKLNKLDSALYYTRLSMLYVVLTDRGYAYRSPHEFSARFSDDSAI